MDQGYSRQKATLTQPGFVPTNVNATVNDFDYLGFRLGLPLGRLLTLRGEYAAGGETYDYDYTEGPFHWDNKVHVPNSQVSGGLTLYTQSGARLILP